MNISLFKSAKDNKQHEEIPFKKYLDGIKNGTWEDEVLAVRNDKREKNTCKAVTPSGLFDQHRRAKEIKTHSGYIAIDIDKKDNPEVNLSEARSWLFGDEYVYAGHLSISGKGLVIYIKINPKKHIDSFLGIEQYMANTYNIIIDTACKDVSRLRYVSYDPDIVINEKAKQWDIFIEKEKIQPATFHNVFDDRDMDYIFSQIDSKRIDLTFNYADWIRIGFALANEFGINGLSYFKNVSKYHKDFDSEKCEIKYNSLLKSRENKCGIQTFFWICKQNNIAIQCEKTGRICKVAKLRKNKLGKNGGYTTEEEAKKSAIDYLENFEGITENESKNIVDQVFELPTDLDDVSDIPVSDQIADYIRGLNIKKNEVSGKWEWHGKAMNDDDYNTIFLDSMSIIEGGKVSFELVRRTIESNRIKSYNPFNDFIDKYKHLHPNGAVNEVINCFNLTHYDPKTDALNRSLILKWMASIVASMQGTYSLLILVIIGEQATGKTKFFRNLLPDELKEYYAESKLDNGKDDELLMCTKLLIVDDEFGGKSKKEATKLKEMSSKQTMNIRKAYGRTEECYKRYAVLGGTSNETEIINDPTGNRRIIPVLLSSFESGRFEKIDKIDVFIELYHMINNDKDFWMLTKDEINWLNSFSESYTETTVEEDMINQLFSPADMNDYGSSFATTTTLINYCEEKLSKQKLGVKRFGQMMRKNGFKRVKNNGIYGFWYKWK